MSGQGYHLAVSEPQAAELLGCNDEIDILEKVNDLLELLGGSRPEGIHGGDKDWNVLLLCLTDGTYDPRGGTYPLNQCFFGGRLLVSEGAIVNLVAPEVARDIAMSLSALGEEWLWNRYSAHFGEEYEGPIPEEDYESAYEELQRFRDYYQRIAEAGMGVVFYTDDCLSYFFDPDRNPPSRR